MCPTHTHIMKEEEPRLEEERYPFTDWAGKDILLILSVFTEEPTFQLVLM